MLPEIIKTHKLTGDIHNDIDTVYTAIDYTECLVQGLVSEWQAQKLKVDTEYIVLLDILDKLKSAQHSMYKVRNWYEPRRFYGPLANM